MGESHQKDGGYRFLLIEIMTKPRTGDLEEVTATAHGGMLSILLGGTLSDEGSSSGAGGQ